METTSVRRSARNHASSRAAAAQEEQARAALETREAAPSGAQQRAATTVNGAVDEQQIVERPRRRLRGVLRADQQAPRSILRLPGSTASIPSTAFRTPDNTTAATLVGSTQTNLRATSTSDTEDAAFANRDERSHPPQWTVVRCWFNMQHRMSY